MIQMSVCIITRDQEEKLQKCLQALQPYPVQIVVVDTGSSDGSKKVAQRYGASVYDFVWCDDFAAAKNYAVTQAEHDMVLVLDTDEYVQKTDWEKLYREVEKHRGQVGRIRRLNHYIVDGREQENEEYINRIFDRRLYEYAGAIHEQLVKKKQENTDKQNKACIETEHVSIQDEMEYVTYRTELTMTHDGYLLSGQEWKKKAERNITLLQQEIEKKPDDPYLYFQVGKSYFTIENFSEAVRNFELALGFHPDVKYEYVEDLVETYGYALLKTGQTTQALELQSYGVYYGHLADYLFLMGLILMNNARFAEATETFLKATALPHAKTKGTNSYMAYYNAGVIKECLGQKEEAKKLYEKCGEYEPAVIGLTRVK